VIFLRILVIFKVKPIMAAVGIAVQFSEVRNILSSYKYNSTVTKNV